MTIYVIYDPLFERPLCVHNKPNMVCKVCKKKEYAKRSTYQLMEKRFTVKTGEKLK